MAYAEAARDAAQQKIWTFAKPLNLNPPVHQSVSLIDAQTEKRHGRQHMIQDIRLDGFILAPADIAHKAVNFNGQAAVRLGLEMADDQG